MGVQLACQTMLANRAVIDGCEKQLYEWCKAARGGSRLRGLWDAISGAMSQVAALEASLSEKISELVITCRGCWEVSGTCLHALHLQANELQKVKRTSKPVDPDHVGWMAKGRHHVRLITLAQAKLYSNKPQHNALSTSIIQLVFPATPT